MRLHRFHVQENIGNQKHITIRDAELFNQLKNVLRYQVGTQLVLFDDTGNEYLAMIEKLQDGNAVFEIIEIKTKKPQGAKREVILYASIIKKDKFEWVVEKATELGVSKIVPIITERTEKKGLKTERLEKIIKEASEQSGRSNIPTLADIIDLSSALENIKGQCIVFDPTGDEVIFDAVPDKIHIFVGPEGGWSDKELLYFKEKKVPIGSLGKQVLRAETASVAILSKLLI